MEDWRKNLLESSRDIAEFLRSVRTVAVVGIKPEHQGDRPAHYVPAALKRAGLRIIPVPVYFPEVQTILGEPVHRSLATIEEPIDVVDVFRRASDVPGHLEEMLAAKPRMVWMQSGIRHPEVAEKLARAGILVVQDRCLMVEYQP